MCDLHSGEWGEHAHNIANYPNCPTGSAGGQAHTGQADDRTGVDEKEEDAQLTSN